MKYYASCSFGKDSIATILLALEHNEPLDGVVFSEVMFDYSKNISGELPEHIEWIYKTAIPKLEELGCKIYIVKSKYDYKYWFTDYKKSGKYIGKATGFAISGRCKVNDKQKVSPIRKFYKSINEEYMQYIGIAIDEPKRLARMKSNQISLLAKYGYTEKMAKELCLKHNLLSPIYKTGTRGGCWFCPNMKLRDLLNLRTKHPELWKELTILGDMPNLCSYGFKYGKTVEEINKQLDIMEYNQKHQLKLFDL